MKTAHSSAKPVNPKDRSGEYWIDRWYDKYSRNWVIQLKDKEDNQIGAAVYTREKEECFKVDFRELVDGLKSYRDESQELAIQWFKLHPSFCKTEK